MTLRELLTEAAKFISAGTGKEIARTGFVDHYLYPEGHSIQMVRTTDGDYDVYFIEDRHSTHKDPYELKDCYIGTVKSKKDEDHWPDIRAWHDARVMCYNSPKVPKEFKEYIKKDINNKLNMDRYEKDKSGKKWYKEID